jgi:hypothetical protein
MEESTVEINFGTCAAPRSSIATDLSCPARIASPADLSVDAELVFTFSLGPPTILLHHGDFLLLCIRLNCPACSVRSNWGSSRAREHNFFTLPEGMVRRHNFWSQYLRPEQARRRRDLWLPSCKGYIAECWDIVGIFSYLLLRQR